MNLRILLAHPGILPKDGSIVLSAGSMFVTAEVMKACQKLEMSLRGAA